MLWLRVTKVPIPPAHLDKAARGQNTQRLPERRAADAQFLGKLQLVGQPVSRAVLLLDDLLRQGVCNAHGQSLGSV